MFKSHIKLSVLHELSRKSLSGYDLIKSLSEDGTKPSPGYIYPLLNDLEAKKFISVKQYDRRKVYSLTAKGKKLLNDLRKHRESMVSNMTRLWAPIADKEELSDFVRMKKYMHKGTMDRDLLFKFHKTLFTVYRKEDPARRKRVRSIIEDSIKRMEQCK